MPDPNFEFLARRAAQLEMESPVPSKLRDGGGDPPYDGGMEARVVKLEDAMTEVRDRLVRIETRMESFETNFATKADLHREINAQTWRLITWMTGICTALVAASYFIAHALR